MTRARLRPFWWLLALAAAALVLAPKPQRALLQSIEPRDALCCNASEL